MSRTLICQYKTFIEIKVPEELAVQIDNKEVQAIDVDWGRLEITDKNGKEYKIEGSEAEVDYSVAQKISWQVKESWPAIKAKILEAESKRMAERMAILKEEISASNSEAEEEVKIIIKEMDGSILKSIPAESEPELVIPFTDSPLHGTIPAK
jgi:hypothetical protein